MNLLFKTSDIIKMSFGYKCMFAGLILIFIGLMVFVVIAILFPNKKKDSSNIERIKDSKKNKKNKPDIIYNDNVQSTILSSDIINQSLMDKTNDIGDNVDIDFNKNDKEKKSLFENKKNKFEEDNKPKSLVNIIDNNDEEEKNDTFDGDGIFDSLNNEERKPLVDIIDSNTNVDTDLVDNKDKKKKSLFGKKNKNKDNKDKTESINNEEEIKKPKSLIDIVDDNEIYNNNNSSDDLFDSINTDDDDIDDSNDDFNFEDKSSLISRFGDYKISTTADSVKSNKKNDKIEENKVETRKVEKEEKEDAFTLD